MSVLTLHTKKSAVPFDAAPTLTSSKQALDLFAAAAMVAKESGDYATYLSVSSSYAKTVLAAVQYYLSQRDLIPPTELHQVEELSLLKTRAEEADQTAETFLESRRVALMRSGAVEIGADQLKGDLPFTPQGEEVGARLAELADQLGKPVFAEHHGDWLLVAPGTPEDRAQRAHDAMAATKLDVGEIGAALRDASRLLSGRLDLTHAQSAKPRTVSLIIQDCADTMIAHGHAPQGLAATFAAIQELKNEIEIGRFAKHLWSLATVDEVVKAAPDPTAAARFKMWSWINTYGTGDLLVKKMWEEAVNQLVEGA